MLLCIGEFGEGRPDFGGRRPAGEAAGQKKKEKKRVAGLGGTPRRRQQSKLAKAQLNGWSIMTLQVTNEN